MLDQNENQNYYSLENQLVRFLKEYLNDENGENEFEEVFYITYNEYGAPVVETEKGSYQFLVRKSRRTETGEMIYSFMLNGKD